MNFVPKAHFKFFIKSKAENQFKFQRHSAPAQRVCTTVKLLCWALPDCIIASNMQLLNISGFGPVDNGILAMLQEWVCQYPMNSQSMKKDFR